MAARASTTAWRDTGGVTSVTVLVSAAPPRGSAPCSEATCTALAGIKDGCGKAAADSATAGAAFASADSAGRCAPAQPERPTESASQRLKRDFRGDGRPDRPGVF